jgi:hypothetical protein
MKNEELSRLKSALIQYNICLLLPFMKIFLKCSFGLCNHFNYNLPKELSNLNTGICYNGRYWFKRGLLKPRIKLLEKAIINTKYKYYVNHIYCEKNDMEV